jgi:peroxiredoxin
MRVGRNTGSTSKATDHLMQTLTENPQVGAQAPDFALQTPDGGTVTLSDLRARRTLLIFQRHLG